MDRFRSGHCNPSGNGCVAQLSVENMVVCRICRKRFKAEDKVCPRCGWRVDELYKANCRFCGELVPLGSKNCPRCGVEFSEEAYRETPLVKPPAEPPPPPYPVYRDWTDLVPKPAVIPEMPDTARRCPVCGASVVEELRECLICGSELADEEAIPGMQAEAGPGVQRPPRQRALRSAPGSGPKVIRKRRLKRRHKGQLRRAV